MEHENGIVERLSKGNRMTVKFVRSEECKGCNGCLLKPDDMYARLVTKNDIGARVGDVVSISMGTYMPLISQMIVYGIPLAVFLLGVLIGALAGLEDLFIGIIAFSGMVAGFGIALVLDRVFKKSSLSVKVLQIVMRANEESQNIEQ